jgi:hypothetical protein
MVRPCPETLALMLPAQGELELALLRLRLLRLAVMLLTEN